MSLIQVELALKKVTSKSRTPVSCALEMRSSNERERP